MTLKFSLIICTKNRAKDLDITLQSVFNQSILPESIIIVDDSENDETNTILKKYDALSSVQFEYIHFNPPNSGLPAARNYGIKKIPRTADIVLFLDDDVTLDSRYLESIREIFMNYPEISGAGGVITNGYFNKSLHFKLILAMIGMILPNSLPVSLFHPSITRTGAATTPLFLRKGKDSIRAEWLSGCNMAYRSTIFLEGNTFDENFIHYALGEDTLFSHQLYKQGKKFLISYNALLQHRVSLENRTSQFSGLLMMFGYHKYVINKFSGNGLASSFYYYYFIIDVFIMTLVLTLMRKNNFGYLVKTIHAYHVVKPFEKMIEKGDLKKFNDFLKEK